MELETILNLFDSYWFYTKTQSKPPISSTPEPPNPNPQIQQNSPKPKFSKQLTLHTRSKSDQFITTNTDINSSPNSINFKSHLQTIHSKKEFSPETPKTPDQLKNTNKRFCKKKGRLSKSLSELEFEELKGFMDLGFVFSEEDKEDSSLVEIIPGLQRMGREEISGPSLKERPYLSEAWELQEERRIEEEMMMMKPLMNWKVPVVSNEIDMKDSLKWWAHSVASAVR